MKVDPTDLFINYSVEYLYPDIHIAQSDGKRSPVLRQT